jgi:hypothetical protein
VYWADSIGRRNTSMMEVVRGGLQASAGAGDQGAAGEDLVSGAAFDGEA